MPDERDDNLHYGINYDLERWTDGSKDESGHLIWHHNLPNNDDWDHIRMVTVNYDFEGEGHYRNIPIHPDRPLDPYGSNLPEYRGVHKGGRYGPEFYYDLDDLVTNYYWGTNTP